MSVIGEGARESHCSALPRVVIQHGLGRGRLVRGARKDKIDLFCLWGEQLHTFTAVLSVHSGPRNKQFSLAKP